MNAETVAIIITISTLIGILYGGLRGIIWLADWGRMKRDEAIKKVVKPMIDERADVVDAKFAELESGQNEIKGDVALIRDKVENGLSEDITHVRNRLDRIFDHLLDNNA